MKITAANPIQSEAIARLINQAYRGNIGWTLEYHLVAGERIIPQEIKNLIENRKDHLFVATEEDLLLGTICVEERDEGIFLGLFAVEPRKQGNNIGKRILTFAENYAKQVLKGKSVRISVISVREEILAYYRRRGYQTLKNDQPFPEAYVPYLKRKDITMTVMEKYV